MNGPKARRCTKCCSPVFGLQLSSVDGLLFRAQWLIVPHSWWKELLERIHESHQGIVKCKQWVQDILFWPGMSSQVEDKVSKCSICKQFQRAQPKEPMVIQVERQSIHCTVQFKFTKVLIRWMYYIYVAGLIYYIYPNMAKHKKFRKTKKITW